MRKVSRAEDFQPWVNYRTAEKEEGSEKNSFKPPSGVQSAAKHALELIADGKAGDGFTSVGRHRAKQLAGGGAVPLSDIKRMHAYFSRHGVDKKGKDWDNDSPGKVAWLAWGGDAGASWAASIVKKHGDSKKKEAGAYPSNSEWENHLDNLERLRTHVLGGLDWHAEHGPLAALKAHQVASDIIAQAVHAVRGVMQFPDATKD